MNRRLTAATIVAGALLAAASPGGAQATGPGFGTPLVPSGNDPISRVATRGANFLEIGLGARAQGMGGAYSALAEGFSAMYYNLAGTAEVQNVAGALNYSQLYGKDGFDFIWGGAILPLLGGGVGLQVGQMSSGEIERTTELYPRGGDPTFGATYEFTSSMAELSYARRLTDRLNFGVGVKYAGEGIADARASYYGADLGIRFRTGLFGTTLGASLANIGSSGRYSGTGIERNTFGALRPGIVRVNINTFKMQMPTVFRFSVMSDVFGGSEALFNQKSGAGSLRAVGEFAQAIDTDLQMALGLEYGLRDIVFLRAGKRWLNENQINGGSNVLTRGDYWRRGLAFGGGVRVPFGGQHVALDYAWQGTGELPANNHFSFEFGF